MRFGGVDTIFNYLFSSYLNHSSGFLINLAPEFLTYIDEPTILKDLFKLYPNPVRQATNVYIEFNQEFQTGESNYSIIDQNGREVLCGNVDPNQEQFQIETTTLLPGAYWVIVNKGNVGQVELLIIQ